MLELHPERAARLAHQAFGVSPSGDLWPMAARDPATGRILSIAWPAGNLLNLVSDVKTCRL